MDDNLVACAQCSHLCMSLHKTKHDTAPIVSSFFKVMLGNDFSDVLYVPPRFAKTITEMEGERTYLEDSTGQKWKVNLSKVNGSLAFQKGWREFSSSHGIKLGEFLIFNYIKGSHFNVQIFGRSGCEKRIIFHENDHPKNRAKVATNLFPKSFRLDSSNKECTCPLTDSVHDDVPVSLSNLSKDIRVDVPKQGNSNKRPKVVPTTDILVDSYFMTDRNTSLAKEDAKSNLFDLSVLEMSKTNIAANGETTFSHENDGNNLSVPLTFKKTDVKLNLKHTKKLQLVRSTYTRVSKELCGKPSTLIAPVQTARKYDKITPSYPSGYCQPEGLTNRIVKKEPRKNEDDLFGANFSSFNENAMSNHGYGDVNLGPLDDDVKIIGIVKPEPIDLCNDTPLSFSRITCSVPQDNESFLVLPEALPMKGRQYMKSKGKLVFLRNSIGKDWPVVYHDRYSRQVLACGWEAFKQANNIHAGDECSFEVDDIQKRIFCVRVLNR
ncbi:uncharacterized protein LOC130813947 isoform X2 [Amaranthus tricolor]|nr:uncharacterized protein LOC130813947 isoform X2 [Amaranthus tricolor]